MKLINNTQAQAFQLYCSFIMFPKRERESESKHASKRIEAFSKDLFS